MLMKDIIVWAAKKRCKDEVKWFDEMEICKDEVKIRTELTETIEMAKDQHKDKGEKNKEYPEIQAQKYNHMTLEQIENIPIGIIELGFYIIE